MTASTILTNCFLDLGVLADGEPMSAPMAQDGLRRLNQLVSSLRTQFGTVLAIERTIFPLVANQQTYTIGPGGDFNVARPMAVNGAGLWLNGLAAALSVSSITRSGSVATVTQTSHPFAVGDEAFIDGANETAYNGLQTVQTVPTANTYTFTVLDTTTSPATGTLTAAAVDGQPVEIPRAVITDDAYQAIQIKNLSNSQFTLVYYQSTSSSSGFGQIFLWPRPNTAQNQLVLYLQSSFGGFATLTTDYTYPDNPGYGEMLQYQLNLRLASPYARPLNPLLVELAQQSLGLVKRANNRLTDVPTDAQVLTNNHLGWYNINTGTP